MLTISSGHSADYLLSAVATGRENYYTGAVAAGEPPGRWYGRGAEQLGLSGLVDHQDMTALYAHFVDPSDPEFKDPTKWDEAAKLGHAGRRYLSADEIYAAVLDAEPDASPERRAELRLDAGQRARQNVAFLDATFSVQKSVTVLHTAFEAQEIKTRRAGDVAAAEAWGAHRQAVEDAIWAGNRAALDYLAEHAGYSRIGHHGGAGGRFIDAHDWTIASFFQHDSRDHDPQLHIHNAILNRVQGEDGVWRTLDGRALYAYRAAAAAVGERTTEEHLTGSLGVLAVTRPDGKAREILGVPPEVTNLLSSRRRAITPKTVELAAAFEQKFGREPNALELDRLQRQAMFATRRAKSHDGETVEQRLDRVDRQLRAEVAGSLASVAHDVLGLVQDQPEPQRWSRTAVIETALAEVQDKQAAWTEGDLTRAISNALPDQLGGLSGPEVSTLLGGLTADALRLVVPLDASKPGDEVLPERFRLVNGRSAFDAPGRRRYATPDHLHTERLLAASTAHRGVPALTTAAAATVITEFAESGIELGVDQAGAVRGVLTSGAQVESLVGPAGTGKSFVVGALAKAWQDQALWDGRQRQAVGLAASQIATEVLTGEGLDARNIARWLATQDRLARNVGAGDDADWQLRDGDLVVVDESAMASTSDLAAVHRYVSAAGAKMLLTGDHRQLAAISAGGAMDLMAEAGACYELAEVRRFAQEWERAASLRLRSADKTVLGEYHKHGRLQDSGTLDQAETAAANAWLGDTLAGQHALLLVDTNEQAARLSAQLRTELVRLGQVEDHGVPLGLQGTYAGVGDLVQARLNGWHLAGHEGNRRGPINREHYRVLATRGDGGLLVAPVLGRGPSGEQLGDVMKLPVDYVREHLALGYASTVHSAQGLTVDTCHAVITPHTGADALYVGLSRGRHANTAHVATVDLPNDPAQGSDRDAPHRDPGAVLATVLDTADPQRSALATAAESSHDAASIRTAAERFAVASELAVAGRTARWLDQLVDDGHLTSKQRLALAGQDASRKLSPLLRRVELAGHDPQRVLAEAITSRSLDGAAQVSNVLHHRIAGAVTLDPAGDSYADWMPAVDSPDDQRYLAALAAAADARRADLGREAIDNPPQWAIDAFGQPAAEADERAEWTRRAGAVAAYRELTGHDDPVDALGRPPKPGQVEAYASWRSAWRALGRPEADHDELQMSNGRLRMRVRAYQREAPWAPRYVANELAGTVQAAEAQRRTAAVRSAEAVTAVGPAMRAELEHQAVEAAALADALDRQVEELREIDDARARWLAHTAGTRAAADRATAVLATRDLDANSDGDLVTAHEWLAAHRVATQAEDAYREITEEADLVDTDQQQVADLPALEGRAGAADGLVETGVPDIRQVTADVPAPTDEDYVRVPDAEETAEAVRQAQRALAEIAQRDMVDEARAAEEARAAQLARWHADDQAADIAARQAAADREGSTLDLAAVHD